MAGAVTLVLVRSLGWSMVYRLSALTLLIGVVATLCAPEPERPAAPQGLLLDAYVRPFAERVFRRGAVAVLAAGADPRSARP